MNDDDKAALRELLRRIKIWWFAAHDSDDERTTLDLVVDQVAEIDGRSE